MLVVLLLVVGFGSSSALAPAYGIAVTGEMLVTTILLCVVMRVCWKWPPASTIVPAACCSASSTWASSLANAVKFFEGGWVPLAVAFAVVLVMRTWMRGRGTCFEKTRRNEVPLSSWPRTFRRRSRTIVPGTAIFLTADIAGRAHCAAAQPQALQGAARAQCHPDRPHGASAARVGRRERVKIEPINDLFYRVIVTFGYMETPNIPKALALCRKLGWKFDIMSTSFFLSRRSLKPSPKAGMPLWLDKLFIALARNAGRRDGIFPYPDRARGGDRHAGDDLTR